MTVTAGAAAAPAGREGGLGAGGLTGRGLRVEGKGGRGGRGGSGGGALTGGRGALLRVLLGGTTTTDCGLGLLGQFGKLGPEELLPPADE